MAPWPLIVPAGAGVGVLLGLFGVGGSAFATPVLALLGVRGVLAVASPLPATMPAALSGVWTYLRAKDLDWEVARWSITGAVPATIAGGLASSYVGGNSLLIASGIVLAVIGVRILRPTSPAAQADGVARRRAGVVVTAAIGVGLFTGLLANGGGFLLVPLYLITLGLAMRTAAGTSLIVVAALAAPNPDHPLGPGTDRLGGRRRLRRRVGSRRLPRLERRSAPDRAAAPARLRLDPGGLRPLLHR